MSSDDETETRHVSVYSSNAQYANELAKNENIKNVSKAVVSTAAGAATTYATGSDLAGSSVSAGVKAAHDRSETVRTVSDHITAHVATAVIAVGAPVIVAGLGIKYLWDKATSDK